MRSGLEPTPTISVVRGFRESISGRIRGPFTPVIGTFILLALVGWMYHDAPPPAHTGGFGEPTCHSCHFDNPLNAPGGEVSIRGLPSQFFPDSTYLLTISLSKRGLQRGGFQLSTRHQTGEQAGSLTPMNPSSQILTSSDSAIQYITHTPEGTRPLAPDTARWAFAWTAPTPPDKPVVFHLAANASNGDDSEFGDFIYLLSHQVSPYVSPHH